MALLNAEFNKASASIAKNGTSMDKLRLNYDKLTNQVKLQADKVNLLRADLDKLTTAEVKNDKAIASKQIALKNAEAQLIKLKTAQDKANTAVSEASTKMGKFKTSLSDIRGSMQDAGVDVERLEQSFMAMSAALASVSIKGVQSFLSFDEAMIKSKTIMDETQVSYAAMTKDVLDLSEKYGKGANDVAEANYQILSSNVATSDASKVLEQSLRLAKTGFTETSVAADALTSIMNAYGMETNEASNIVDQLVMTQKLGKLTIGELGETIGYVTSISAQCGVSINEVNAAIATMTRSGTNAETAITQTRQIIASVIAPTAEAAEAAKDLGIQFNAAALERKGFNGFMEDIIRKTDGSADEMAKLFGNVRSLSGMLSLAKNDGKEYAEVLSQIENSAGTADKALNDVSQTASGKFNTAFNALQTSLIKVGAALEPLILLVADFMNWLANLNPAVLATIGVIGGLSLGVKALGFVFGPLNTILKATAVKLGLVSATSAVAGTASATAGGVAAAGGTGFMMLGTGANVAMGPLLLIVAVIAAVGLVIALVCGGLSSLNKGLNDASKTAGKTAQDTVREANKAQQAVKGMEDASANTTKRMYKASYATGTQFVPEDGYYRVNEYGQQETFLRRGDKVLNGAQTRQLNDGGDNMSETNNLLKTLCMEFKAMKTAYENQPREMQRIAREGV